ATVGEANAIEEDSFVAQRGRIAEATVNTPFRPDERRSSSPQINVIAVVEEQHCAISHTGYLDQIASREIVSELLVDLDPVTLEPRKIDCSQRVGGAAAIHVNQLHSLGSTGAGSQGDDRGRGVAVASFDLMEM